MPFSFLSRPRCQCQLMSCLWCRPLPNSLISNSTHTTGRACYVSTQKYSLHHDVIGLTGGVLNVARHERNARLYEGSSSCQNTCNISCAYPACVRCNVISEVKESVPHTITKLRPLPDGGISVFTTSPSTLPKCTLSPYLTVDKIIIMHTHLMKSAILYNAGSSIHSTLMDWLYLHIHTMLLHEQSRT